MPILQYFNAIYPTALALLKRPSDTAGQQVPFIDTNFTFKNVNINFHLL